MSVLISLSRWLSPAAGFLASKCPKDDIPLYLHSFNFPGLPKSHFLFEASTDIPQKALPFLNFSEFPQSFLWVSEGTSVVLVCSRAARTWSVDSRGV